MNTSNAGSLGGMIPPATAETGVSPESPLPTSRETGNFEELIKQSIEPVSSPPKDVKIPVATVVPGRVGNQSPTVTAAEIKKSDGKTVEAKGAPMNVELPPTAASSTTTKSAEVEVSLLEHFVMRPPFRWNRVPVDGGVPLPVETPVESKTTSGSVKVPQIEGKTVVEGETDGDSDVAPDLESPAKLVEKILAAGLIVSPGSTSVTAEPTVPRGSGVEERATESEEPVVLSREQQASQASAKQLPVGQLPAEGEPVRQPVPTEKAAAQSPQLKSESAEQGKADAAPTRRTVPSTATAVAETRRFDFSPDTDRQRDPNVTSFRMESLAAARFAAAAGRQYQLADVESLIRSRRRDDSSETGGIRAAQRDITMKNSGQENQIAGMRVQNVPGSGRDGNGSPNIVAGGGASLSRTGEAVRETDKRFGTSVGEVVSMAFGGLRGGAGSHSTSELPPLSTGSLKTSEQLILSLTREVMQFKNFKSDSMAVVLKPDKNTEIFLHLAMRNGAVEVQARFDRGDFAAVNSQWAQLQQTMQQQGVKLGSLQESLEQQLPNPKGDLSWGHGNNQSQRDGNLSDEKFIEALDEKLIFGSGKEPVKRPDRTRTSEVRGSLEAWA